MEGEEAKPPSWRVPFSELNQVSSDFILAIAMQEQEHAYTMLETIESDTEEEEEDDDQSDDDDDDDDDDASSNEIDHRQDDAASFDFLEEENSGSSSSDREMEEDDDGFDDFDLDVDELTYEELIALGEFIGEEKRGLPSNEISTCLHPYTCKSSSSTVESKTSIDRCVICQLEYDDEDGNQTQLVALPCEHPYHWECISRWLQIKNSCPICSTEVSSPKTKTVF